MAASPDKFPQDELDVDLSRADPSSHAIAMLEKHKNIVMLTALLAALAICGVLVVRELAKQRRIEAGEAFSEAAAERSIEKLDAVAANHRRTVAAGNALLTKADLQMKMEKPQDAKATLLAFLEKYPNHPGTIQALFSLGNLAQLASQSAEADEYYDKALMKDPGGHLALFIHIRKGDLLLAEADALLAEGNKEESENKKAVARSHYEAFIKEPQLRASPFIEIAEERIELLALGNPPVVSPPPKPAPKSPEPEKKPAEPASGKPAEPAGAAPKPATPAPSAAPKPQTTQPAPAKPATPAPSAAPKPQTTQPAPVKPATPAPSVEPKPQTTQPAPAKPATPAPSVEPKPQTTQPAPAKPATPAPSVEPKPQTTQPAPAKPADQ